MSTILQIFLVIGPLLSHADMQPYRAYGAKKLSQRGGHPKLTNNKSYKQARNQGIRFKWDSRALCGQLEGVYELAYLSIEA